MSPRKLGPVAALAVGLCCSTWSAAENGAGTGKPVYSPYADRAYPTHPLFGETHLHTGFSMDAGASGTRLTPADAYRFARGEQVTTSTGQPAKLGQPLDFLAVTDHSDGMGFFPLLMAGGPRIMADPQGRKWLEMINAGQGMEAALDIVGNFSKGTISKDIFPFPGSADYKNAWKQTVEAAESFNEPGQFTALIAYEWTSNTDGNNLHRNVIYRDGGDMAGPIEPYTTIAPAGSDNPVDLWRWMGDYERQTGGNVLAIAHNGNLSNGRMFPLVEAFGKALDEDYVAARARWEPLYEVTQTKGDGEAHPFLSPTDEFADFETWDKGNLDLSALKTRDMLQYEYARAGLKNGLLLEQQLGTNPYRFGMVGSSDAHTGLAAMEEENFFGKVAPQEPSPERMTRPFIANVKAGVAIMDWEVSSAGVAAVWARENTRESIFDAMKRRETYATTGTRMIVRFFGGWDFTAADAARHSLADAGYARGVPMGGELPPGGRSGGTPTFLVAAAKDPAGANLDRIQIIKGWLDKDGELQEEVYDVAWSDHERREQGTGGELSSVGSSVNVEEAAWTNTIGDPDLSAVWQDPAFDPRERAFYYARVLEIPTPRWTAYDAKRFGVRAPGGARMVLQERAYTSPIWYTPGG